MYELKIPNNWINKNIKVAVVGAGGTGSILLSLLAQMSYNMEKLSNDEMRLNVTAIDGDTVSEFNIGRQSFYPADIGEYKAQVLVQRLNQFMGTHWRYENENAEPDDLEHFDLVITCVDSAKFRYELGDYYDDDNSDALWLDCGNNASDGQVIFGNLGQGNKDSIPNIHTLYGDLLNSIEERPEDSCSHEAALSKQDFGINHTIAVQAVSMLWQLVRHGELSAHGAFIDLKSVSTNPLKIDPNIWQSFGWEEADNEKSHELT